MSNSPPPQSHESRALANALRCFLSDHIEEGKAELLKVRPELLDRVYTAGVRLGVEAHALKRSLSKQ